MNKSVASQLQRYFDRQMTQAEIEQLQDLIQADPQVRGEFVRYALLHDRLRGHFLASQAFQAPSSSNLQADSASAIGNTVSSIPPRSKRRWLVVGSVAATLLVSFILWQGTGLVAQAEQIELRRVIAANSANLIRSFEVAVELVSSDQAKSRRAEVQRNRPPKAPLDEAILHVRGKQEFVLIRKTLEGDSFITGSDGMTSWAVRDEGPVRVSNDLQRFNRDVPGHEYSMPLNNLHDALQHLQLAFDLHVLPEPASPEPRKLLIAIKRKGFPGPRRVEITYLASGGQIEQLRMVDMPYGPDRLTVRLTLVESPEPSADFFSHTAYHSSNRQVEVE